MDSHESNICVISLDALNLNFLQSRYQQKQTSCRAKNSLEFSTDFYYEFELHKDEEFDVNKEKSSNQELVYITCHICKIQVPQNFYHDHKYSFKHEINTKIANLAVQRLQKHLNCNYDIVNVTTNNSSTHFCPVCVTVMDNIEKKSHENSVGHKNSVIVERILNEFLTIYENAECQNDSSTLNTNSKKEMDVAIKRPFKNKNCLRYINETWNHCVLCNLGFENVDSHLASAEHEKNLKTCVLYDSNNCKTNEEALTSSSVSVNNDTNKCNETHPLYSEDLSMRDVNEHQKLSEDTEEDKSLNIVGSESSDLNKITVNQKKLVENVHEKQFCIYCNVFISKKGLKKHSDTTKHHMNTWSDFHYFMKVIDADDTHHYLCRVCDEKVEKPIDEVKKHALLPKHLQNYNALLSRNSIKKVGKDIFFCYLCSVNILIKNEIFHINSSEHKRVSVLEAQNTSCAESNAITSNSFLDQISIPTPPLQLKTEIKNEGIKETKSYFCDICNVFVPNTKYNIETHIKGGRHNENMKQMFDKKVDVEQKDTVEGNTNNVMDKNEVQIDNLKKETKDICADKKLGNNYYNLQKTENPHILKCLACDVFLTNNETNIGTHVNGLNHLNNYTIIIKTNHLEVKDNDVYCNICSVHISIGNEISHCKGRKHVSKISSHNL